MKHKAETQAQLREFGEAGMNSMHHSEKIRNCTMKVGVIGLGYVGLPLAVEFGKKYDTVGFDVKKGRLEMLRRGIDVTLETSSDDLKAARRLTYSDNVESLRDRDIIIVAVPTPVDRYNRPDLTPLYRASETVGKALRKGMIVVYESTVYPGCTEEECVPVLERVSGLKFNVDFFCGYSPERINPGDKEHTLLKIKKSPPDRRRKRRTRWMLCTDPFCRTAPTRPAV